MGNNGLFLKQYIFISRQSRQIYIHKSLVIHDTIYYIIMLHSNQLAMS